MTSRQIREIAADIQSNWKYAPKDARHSIEIMLHVDHIEDDYRDDYETGLNRLPSYLGCDDARSIVTSVLNWIKHNWRGEKAKAIKAELETILKEKT
tara:strand:+ start:991 stop:1281 length:291 start_codon:yes stop_codon:yes gene_type:complete